MYYIIVYAQILDTYEFAISLSYLPILELQYGYPYQQSTFMIELCS